MLPLAGIYVWRLGNRIKLYEHEYLVAETARDMLNGGHSLVPHFAGLVRLQKTPLPYWLVGLLGWAGGGIHEWVVYVVTHVDSVELRWMAE